jgi:serine/threonine-protein kinase
LDPRYEALLAALGSRFRIKSKRARAASAEPKGVDRRALIAGGSAAALAIAGGGAWFALRPGAAASRSIAVLPFENLSGDPNQAYFSDGIAEELRSDLSRIPGLKVVARTSSEAVRNVDAVTAAAKLHVSDILTGSVRRSAQMLRISAQLIDGKDGTERWSDVYDRPLGDALQIQSDIASRVADALSLRIGSLPDDYRARGGTDNPQAQDLLLRSKAASRTADTEQAMRDALGLIDAALALDPKYGDAITAKSGMLARLGSTFAHGQEDWAALSRQSEQEAVRGVSVAPKSSAARVALGLIYFSTFRFGPALEQFKSVLASGDASALELSSIAWCVGQLRRFDQALSLSDQAVSLDPLNPQVHLGKANILDWMRRLPEAEKSVSEAIRLAPGLMEARGFYVYLLFEQGRFAEAKRATAAIASSTAAQSLLIQSAIAQRLGEESRAKGFADQILHSTNVSAVHYQLAEMYAAEGQPDEAIAQLEAAWAARDPGLLAVQVDFLLDPIRNDPRFRAIVKRMNFPA